MPRDLPGLYWDEDKKRYFPLGSKPANTPPGGSSRPQGAHARPLSPLLAETEEYGPAAKRRRMQRAVPTEPWTSLENVRSAYAGHNRRRDMHAVESASIALTSRRRTHQVTNAGITSFCRNTALMNDDGDAAVMVGDSQGWLFALHGATRHAGDVRQLSLASSISSVCAWGTRFVATSFGSPCRVVVREDEPTELWTILTIPEKHCRDAWGAHLYNRSLVIGAAKRALLLPDIDVEHYNFLYVGSDVLSIFQDEHLVYTGARSGCVDRFDKRLGNFAREDLLDQRFLRTTSSITHLNVMHEWELLVSTIRGDLETHDLRFLRNGTPLMQFKGHYNTYSTKLGLAVDPREEYIFAAGQDCRVRVWSMRTGGQLEAPLPSSSSGPPTTGFEQSSHRLFGGTFAAPVVAMHVADTNKGMRLWASCEGDLHEYYLGQHDVDFTC